MTNAQKRLSNKYLTYRFFTSLFFLGTVWLYFYRLFITDQQVGFLDGMAFAIGLIAEVPSGALADKFGRDKIVRLGLILAGSGFIIQALGSSFIPFFVGQAILMIGFSFTSGADEALFFEKLKFDQNSVDWRKLLTRGSQIALVASIVAYISGGYIHSLNPRLPWILTGVAFLMSAVIIWPIKEDRSERKAQKFFVEIKEYLHDIFTGFAQFRLPKLIIYVPLIIAVQGLYYSFGWGLLRMILLDRFYFTPFVGSLAVASSSLLTVSIVHLMHKYAERVSEKHVLVIISLSAIAGLLLSIADIGLWGYVVILSLYVGEHVMYPFMSEIINNEAPENQRATVLSVASFMRTLPYVLLAPIIGYVSTNGKLEYFLIGWSIFISLALLLYLSAKKRDVQIKLD